jgi:hypothetical protein
LVVRLGFLVKPCLRQTFLRLFDAAGKDALFQRSMSIVQETCLRKIAAGWPRSGHAGRQSVIP